MPPHPAEEWDPKAIASQLRGDEDFRGERATKPFPYDAERIEAVVMHVQAGTLPKVRPEDVRRAFAEGTAGTAALDTALCSLLSELERAELLEVFQWCGAPPRSIAAFFRAQDCFSWTVPWVLNTMSDKGCVELPFAIEKRVLAGDFGYMGA